MSSCGTDTDKQIAAHTSRGLSGHDRTAAGHLFSSVALSKHVCPHVTLNNLTCLYVKKAQSILADLFFAFYNIHRFKDRFRYNLPKYRINRLRYLLVPAATDPMRLAETHLKYNLVIVRFSSVRSQSGNHHFTSVQTALKIRKLITGLKGSSVCKPLLIYG